MSVSFSSHVDLLDLHGRAAVASLSALDPEVSLPPRGQLVREAAADHASTLEVWAWLVAHPSAHWSEREDEPVIPTDHHELVALIGATIDRLEASLLDAGPEVELDYFDSVGTTAQVARLLAHEAITVAHAASLAAGRNSPALTGEVAVDGIDQALRHWEDPEAKVSWQPATVALRATDTGDAWHLELGHSGTAPEFRLVPAADPVVIVEGGAVDLLWWLHGHESAAQVSNVSGALDVVTALRTTLEHPLPEPARRRRWFG